MDKISRELLRIAEERLIMCERELDNIEPNAPEWRRQDLEKRVREARENLAFKTDMVRRENDIG